MANNDEVADLRRSLISIANALTDRATLIRALVDELLTAMVQKGLFTEEETRAISERAIEQREKQRAEYRIPDDKAATQKLAKLHDELSADVIDLAAVRARLERE